MKRSSEQGFTLVELLVSMVLLGVVGSVVVSAIVTGMQSARTTTARTMAIHELEVALQRVGRELRAADPLYVSENGAYGTQIGAEVVRNGQVQVISFAVVEEDGQQFLVQDTAIGDIADIESGVVELTTLPRRTLVTAVDNGSDPVFTYFDDYGDPIVCTPPTPGPSEACDLAYSDAYKIGLRLERTLSDQSPVRAETYITVRNMRYRSG
ncbi:type II secretion system protein J [Egicoccus sp. AB-alg6-2]|uniref:type II secretion system protein J n=1 Tax=Egicoccus sp. AB-alg6-2 TaxID=3242692 RepID=UPI00359CC574